MVHVTLISQKPTSTSIPTEIRDLAQLRWCFGVSTLDSAVACLGDDIRQYDTMQPTQLQDDSMVGVGTALLKTGTSPYTHIRFPAVGDDLADDVVRQTAHLKEPRRVCVACVGLADGCLRCHGSGVDPDESAPVLTAV